MFVAYRDHGTVRVPGESSEFVMLDGAGIVVRGFAAYLNADDSLEPGYSLSPIKTDIVYTHFREHGATYEANRRVRPVVCNVCHDSGEDGRGRAGLMGWCEGCHGYGDEKNLHVCAQCGEASDEPLPCIAPREGLNHPLLLARMHHDCCVELLRTPPLVERGAA